MATKTTLNAKNLEALGTQLLAELLIEISMGSAANKRRLRMELAGSHSSGEVAREVRKRLGSIARARTFISWRRVKATKADLETQRKTIVETVAPDDPSEGFELIWQFLALGEPIFDRTDDASGVLLASFHQACSDAGTIASASGIDPDILADRVLAAVQNNGHGQFDPFIPAMAPALGAEGLDRLKSLLVQWLNEPDESDRHRETTVRIALQAIADATGDVDAYIAQQPEKTRRIPVIAAEIARRLLSAGRADDALQALDGADVTGSPDREMEWQLARAETLETLGRTDEAQVDRWRWFEQSLSDIHLRAFLKRLPDFDDMDAEERAFAYAQTFPDVHEALAFFLRWPALGQAAKLVINRPAELNGDLYDLMTPAAEALSPHHPLAATLILRSMIDFSLDHGKASRYKHAARHLATAQALAPHILDPGTLKSHEAYVAALKRLHGSKRGFWKHVA
ncbi:DUF6880 family protein [Neorhizobium sp. AL 9.2.2]|uniref:DUF6880 family protein n=1 Tax=Neorhizobium sp. AL 9.2.2 TaxID=2712894 RepID=UPI0015741752|nr:DUF6880 family protein [Neorhizobium sp. AL 9.2.2]NSY19067.1 hypothetical protein [Neorhizobium sp. AL 9.2.2]